jgi:hypothetical protein
MAKPKTPMTRDSMWVDEKKREMRLPNLQCHEEHHEHGAHGNCHGDSTLCDAGTNHERREDGQVEGHGQVFNHEHGQHGGCFTVTHTT